MTDKTLDELRAEMDESFAACYAACDAYYDAASSAGYATYVAYRKARDTYTKALAAYLKAKRESDA